MLRAAAAAAALLSVAALAQTPPGAPGTVNRPGQVTGGTQTGADQQQLLNAPLTEQELLELDEAELAKRAAQQAAAAHGWFIQPILGVRAALSDNAPLAPSGGRKSDIITTATAGAAVYVRTASLKADGTFTLEGDDYIGGHGTSRVLGSGGLDATWDAAAHVLFLEGGFASTKTSNNPFALSPTTGSTANTSSLTQFRLSPYLEGDLSGRAYHYLARSENGWTPGTSGAATFADRPFAYGGRQIGQFEMRAMPLGALLWVERDQSRYGAPADQRLTDDTARVVPRYRLGPSLLLGARFGYERNDYALTPVDRRRRIVGGELEWTPDPLTRLRGFAESRAFGPAWQAELKARGPYLALNANGARETTTSAQSMFRVNAIGDLQALVDAVYTARYPDPSERARIVQQLLGGTGLSATDLHGSVGLYTPDLARISQYTVSMLFVTQREFIAFTVFGLNNELLQLSPAQQALAKFALGSYNELGTTLVLTHRLQRRTALTLKDEFARTRGLGEADQSRSLQRRLTLQANRTISRQLDAVAGVMHQSLTSTVVPGVTEDEIFAGIVYRP